MCAYHAVFMISDTIKLPICKLSIFQAGPDNFLPAITYTFSGIGGAIDQRHSALPKSRPNTRLEI
jgi:hypothetical protein